MFSPVKFNVPADHPAFPGHFPGQPIVPGVVLLDEALHALESQLQKPLSHYTIASAKFLSPVSPDEALQVIFEQKNNGAIGIDIYAAERKVATASITIPERVAK